MRLLILTTPELAPGYRLAGVATVGADGPADAATRLRELLQAAGEHGIVAVHEPYLDALDDDLRRRVDESREPLVVALPPGDAVAGVSERRARLLRMLWQAVGYHITLEPEDGR